MEPPNRVQPSAQAEKSRQTQQRQERMDAPVAGGGPPPAPPDRSKRSFGSSWKTVAAGLAVVVGVAAGAFFFQNSSSDQAPSSQEEARIEAAFAAAEPLQLQIVPASGIADAMRGLSGQGWASDRTTTLQQDAEAHRVQLVSLTFWDTQAEDGDVVQVESPGYPAVTVQLKHARTTVVVPAPASGILTVRGIIDGGGGGITVGILSGGKPIDLPYLVPGQTISIPVKPLP